MAATDEEGENKNDDPLYKQKGKNVSIMHQELVNKLTKSGTSYEEKVGIILSGWDRLAGTATSSQLDLATLLRKWTLQLLLQGDWPKLEKIVITRLKATLQRCARNPFLQQICNFLLPLVSDPWGHPTLKAIFSHSSITDEEAEKYIKEEMWDLVRVRVDTLIDSKCEELALSVLQVCIRCLRMNTRSDDFLYSQEDHNHFVDLFFVLFYKYHRTKFVDELRNWDVIEGVEHVSRLITRPGVGKIWKHKFKIAELEIKFYLASYMVKPYDETFICVFKTWCEVMKTTMITYDELCEMVRKYLEHCKSSHIYNMSLILHQKFGASHNALVTELLIRALTLDMNSLEVIKYESKEKTEHQMQLEYQMANGFIDLSNVFEEHIPLARESVLTAFSIYPTSDRLEQLKKFAFTKTEIKKEYNLIIKKEISDDEDEKHILENNNEFNDDFYSSFNGPVNVSNKSHLNCSFAALKKQCGNQIKGEFNDSMDGFIANADGLIEQLKLREDIVAVKKEISSNILLAPQEIIQSEKLGISKELSDDLAAILSSPRWQVLSWLIDKDELLSLCERYLSDTNIKNTTKELNFLNLDYTQFEHMPSAVVNEYSGIEKGYEKFMDDESIDSNNGYSYRNRSDLYSSDSDYESSKKISSKREILHRRRRRPHSKRIFLSSSDSDDTSRRDVTSETDDSDYEPCYMTGSKPFEGKRITAVSCSERRKRLRIDSTTGKVKQKHSAGSSLRLYRHKSDCATNPDSTPAKDEVKKFLSTVPTFENYAASLPAVPSSENSAPSLSTIHSSENSAATSILHVENKSKVINNENHGWKYAGYLVSNQTKPSPKFPSIAIRSPNPSSNRPSCSYRTNRGNVITLNTRLRKDNCCGKTLGRRNIHPSKFEESFAKFVLAQNPGNIVKPKQNKMSAVENNIKYLERLKQHGTSVTLKKSSTPSKVTLLADVQKKMFNQIQNLNSDNNIRKMINPLGFQTIAMPVSHNPPNLPPNDKSSPVGLRVLPKGTTVVRKSKSESSGAGPSGLNNGGSSSTINIGTTIVRPQSRTAISITPSSNTYLISSVSPFTTQTNARNTVVRTIMEPNSSPFPNENQSPLVVATVVGSVSQAANLMQNSLGETRVSVSRYLNNQVTSGTTTTTTVASQPGETRAPSMLETLLRDRASPLVSLVATAVGNSALTTTTCSISEPLAAVSPLNTGISFSASYSESGAPSTSHPIINRSCSAPESANTASALGSGTALVDTNSIRESLIGGTVLGSNLTSNILTAGTSLTSGNVIVSGVASQAPVINSGVTISNSSDAATGMPQVMIPTQLIQVQGNVGSGLSIVHPGLDLRLPPGTRVLKSTANIRATAPINQSGSRPLNVLHKIVPNRQILRTVMVPHSVPLQNLGTPGITQLVALSNNSVEFQVSSKIQSSQLQKLLGHNVIPGGLLIRTVRPVSTEIEDTTIQKPPNPTTIIHHTADASQQKVEKAKDSEKPKVISVQASEEGLAERLNRHYLKAIVASTSTQSVGTQTQTTAVKPVTGQFVMNQLRGMNNVATTVAVTSSIPSPSPLNLGQTNVVSSETLEQLREFESVFEKVSNKSVSKESESTPSQSNFPNSNVSSEESMIAAQLLSMANETPVTTASSFVYSITSAENQITTTTLTTATSAVTSGGVLGGNTFITIPGTNQPGTLILVNPSVSASSIVTMASSQPPPAASPALSSTSSHSSVASSPSSTSSKKLKTVPPVAPKSPPPPKAPPKPALAKPQVEESDETKARIQAILEQYKLDLANTPQPQPAPRNRKNCPPPKNEGKSSSKKKGTVKKTDGTASSSPGASDHMPSVSSSPAPSAVTPSGGEDSEGSMGGTASQFLTQDEKVNTDETPTAPIYQGVMVSNMKVDNSVTLGGLATLSQGRLVQIIRHGNKYTAITTGNRQNFMKSGLASGGPPPNVTIQGRININELMENQLTLLTSGGSTTLNQNSSSLISKLLQSQQSSVQQVLVQNSNITQGQSVQVALQPVIARPLPNVIETETSLSPSPTPDPTFLNTEDDSNSSHEGGLAGPLPPFSTLTKQFLAPSLQQKFREKTLNDTASPELRHTHSPDDASSASSSHTSYFTMRKNVLLSSPSSPLMAHTNQSSEPSSLESSPSQRPTLNAASQLRSNSLDSIKSDLSVEEVPPSPATLTKQLQNAYMTEAALSPTVSQSQKSSGSSYSSPSNMADLQFSETPSDHLARHLGTAGANRSDASSLACLSLPSDDVYLDHGELELDSLVKCGRAHSPCLSDLAPPVPLLSWSPRSNDSIMAQSPSLNDALVGSMNLHHSEDSLCDSSTGFPGLFSMEGDAASVSSNDDLQQSSSLGHPSESRSRSQSNGTREQDQTVTSTAQNVKKEDASIVSLPLPLSSSQWNADELPIDMDDDKIFKYEEQQNPRRRSQRNTLRHSTSTLAHNGYEEKFKEESDEHKVVPCNLDSKSDCSSDRQTRGSKRRSADCDVSRDEKRQSRMPELEDDDDDAGGGGGMGSKVLRDRHMSGTSDSSSSYSVDRVSTPGLLDLPLSAGRRKRRTSWDSSASSRDGSPLLPPQQEGSGNARRSSSRDHAKKTRCRCCVDSQQGRRRASRGSGPSTS